MVTKTALLKGETTDHDLGFIIGMIEGEGTITIAKSRNNLHPLIRIANTKYELLERCRQIMGGSIFLHRRPNPKYKELYDFQLFGVRTVLETLKRIKPFLISFQKKNLCDLVIRYCEGRVKRTKYDPTLETEWKMYKQVKQLNNRTNGGRYDWISQELV